ncbi:MAG: hypothetical protein V4653_08485 [Pseudomonadota bacterium]
MSRYSQLYIDRGKSGQDSARFRKRLGAYAQNIIPFDKRYIFIDALTSRLGISLPYNPNTGVRIATFFDKSELRDVLDAITLVSDVLLSTGYKMQNLQWKNTISAVISEENLAYRLDESCIVHPLVDLEFERNRYATVEALSDVRFGEARSDFDAAFGHLRTGQGKQAIRMMFPAVETAAKVLHPGAFARLGPVEVDRYFGAHIQRKYEGNEPAITSGRRMLFLFKEWINASQPYRHGQEVEDAAEPPVELVVMHLSTGAALLRWMIDLSA